MAGLLPSAILSVMLTHEIMTHRPVTAMPDTRLDQAAGILRRNRFRHLPVVYDGRLYGVISDRDIQRATAAGAPGGATIEAFARRPVITAAPDTPVEHVARLMAENKVGCLPIVAPAAGAAGDDLVGIVTESDVFGAFIRSLGVLEPGSRLAIHLEDPAEDLHVVAGVLRAHGAPLLSLSTEPLAARESGAPGGPTGGLGSATAGGYAHAGYGGQASTGAVPRLRLLVRLGTINPRPVVAALRRQGLIVEDPVEWLGAEPGQAAQAAQASDTSRVAAARAPGALAPSAEPWVSPEAAVTGLGDRG